MNKYRIIKWSSSKGEVRYLIKKRCLFGWKVETFIHYDGYGGSIACLASFRTIEEAIEALSKYYHQNEFYYKETSKV